MSTSGLSTRRRLTHPDGAVDIDELADGRRRVRVTQAGTFVSKPECVTRYPVDLVEKILAVKGVGYLCDEIQREEDPDYVALFLRYSLLGYLPEAAFARARILDFGSGSGASTAILGRMFPDAHVVGVELEPAFVEIADARAEHYGLHNIQTLVSPDPTRLPDGIGRFDFVNLAAVYEHLLPAERRRLLPQLWSVLTVGGVLFVNQLPHRFYPLERHTTSLPLINYLPDRLAHAAATRYSRRVAPDASWPELLRAGIRGGTRHEVLSDIRRAGGKPVPLKPTRLGLSGHADLWHAYSAARRPHPVKRGMRVAFAAIERLAGVTFAPGLCLAIRKAA